MAHRINTRNFENGEQMTVRSWEKFFVRHWQEATREKLIERWGGIPAAKRAIDSLTKKGRWGQN